MRSNEERIAAMHRRASELKIEQRRRKILIIQAVSTAACLAIVVVAAVFLSGLVERMGPSGSFSGMNASVFSDNPALGLIIIGILAFLLGISVTIFCFRLRRWQEESEKEIRL